MDSNNDILSELAGQPEGSNMTNNQLLEQIALNSGGGGGGTGKSQIINELTGQIDSDSTAVFIITGGGTYTIGDPLYDGQVIPVAIGDGGGVTLIGDNMGVGETEIPVGIGAFDYMAVDMAQIGGSGIMWFNRISVVNQG